ncbi:YolD-like family protein [Bacillus sp. FSL K6-3431]|uniref:YolD-like family protein n=1 Tax=Bacillus sp. FSL K6-3431 TaxID=2921500 RepID=UPI0030FAA443
MLAIPKPKKVKKESMQTPKLTEEDYIEIGERISEAYEFESPITITTFRNRKHEKFTGIITGMNAGTKMIDLDTGEIDRIKISVNIIVDVQ